MHALSVSFGIVGGGWRAEFFLRIARDLPAQFPLAGVVVRDAARRRRLADEWRVPVFATAEQLVAQSQPAFVVSSVPWSANLPLIEELAARGVPVLSETPVAPELEDLHRVYALAKSGARIQVAEQYLFQPLHAARLCLVRGGRLGTVYGADVSVAHGYHGISLLRHYLQVGLRLPRITAYRTESRLIAGPGRGGAPAEHAIADTERVVAHLDFGAQHGIYDFSGAQYFSWIRSPHLLVRGEKGEINQTTVRTLLDYRTPLTFDLARRDGGVNGNLENYSLQAIVGGGETLYRNPFPTARWSDDETAIATSLEKMQNYVATGEEFYGVAEACQDRYLDLLIDQAVSSKKPVTAEAQPWSPH